FGEFDHDAVNADEHAELWLIRAPTAAMKSSLFQGVKISLRSCLVGDIHRKSAAENYDRRKGVQEGGTAATTHVGVGVGAEELGNLSVLLPCKRKGGKYYLGACSLPPS
ncbi:hypothetical protein BGW80DRAFT_1357404, partial [Lactifluus volemus]